MIALALAALLVVPAPAARGGQDQSDERIQQLIAQLAADYEDERAAARKELETIGAKAEPHLVEGLKKSDHRIKKGCLELLTIIKSTKAVELASGLFRATEEEKTVRQAAFDYLRTTGKLAEDVLIEALDSAEQKWRRDALQTLTECKSEKCAEKVANLYDKETDQGMKALAFTCLQNIGKPAQPYLLKLLGSTDAAVRKGAITGLIKIGVTDELFGPVSKLFLVESSAETLTEAYNFLEKAGAKAEPVFLEGLKSAQEMVRLKSIDGLKQLKSEAALEPLAGLFESDPSDGVRNTACDALEAYGARAEDPLVHALGNANPKVRLRAIKALGAIKGEKPYDRIAELFRTDKDAEVHRYCWEYIRSVGIRAEKELLSALKDEDSKIRQEAIESLGNARSAATIEPLLDALVDLNDKVRDAAENALVEIGDKAITAVETAAASGRIKKKSAEKIIHEYTKERVEDALFRLVTKEGGTGHFEGQFADLEKFGKERSLPVLTGIATTEYKWRPSHLNSESQEKVRQLAVRAVGLWGDDKAADALQKSLPELAQYPEEGDEEYEERVIALYRLGRKKPHADLTAKLRKDAETALKADKKRDAYTRLFSLAHMQSRMGERDEALKAYVDLARQIEEHKQTTTDDGKNYYCSTLYNIACLYALQGDKAKAIEFLEKSVDAGFKDREWIQMDKDLDAVRGEERYKKLIGDDERFKPPPQ